MMPQYSGATVQWCHSTVVLMIFKNRKLRANILDSILDRKSPERCGTFFKFVVTTNTCN